MLLRTAEELLLIEYEILLVVLVVKFLAYLRIKHPDEYFRRNEEYWWMKDWKNGTSGWPIDAFNFTCLCCGSLFYPWFKFYILLFLGMVMYDNDNVCVWEKRN